MLTPLQLRVAGIVAGLPESHGFALAGGSALIVRGDVTRRTRDLDFFGLSADAVDRLVPRVEQALASAELSVERVQVSPGFARLVVASDEERTELDLGADARLFPIEPGDPAPTLSGEELAVDKVLAIFGRAEARDFADLMALEPRYGLESLLARARDKDRGFDVGVFIEMLDRVRRLRRDEFDLGDADYVRLVEAVARWRAEAFSLSERGESS